MSGEPETNHHRGTLRVQRPFGTTLVLTVFVLAALLGGGELVARNERFQAKFTAPDLDSRHYQLGRKLALLDSSIRQFGPLECLAIGSSTVDLGFDPAVFASSFEKETGTPLHCFNFGIDALPMAGTAALAQILVGKYQPQLLIVGTDARDYAVDEGAEDAAVILETDWVRYQLGQKNPAGWLVEHSYLYRYRRILGRLTRFNFEDWGGDPLNFEISPDGQTRVATTGNGVDQAPSENDDSFIVRYLMGLLGNYEMLSENIEGLQKVAGLRNRELAVFIVEMPVPAGYLTFFGDGEADYRHFRRQVDQISESAGVDFVRATPSAILPEDGWVDYLHLNASGARIFSHWLAKQISALATETKPISPQEPIQ